MSPPSVTVNDKPACKVRLAFEYQTTFKALPDDVREESYTAMKFLALQGHRLTRPQMGKLDYDGKVLDDPRELIVKVNRDPWRFLYVFHEGIAVILTGGCKAGKPEDDFYATLLREGERVFKAYKAREDAEKVKKKRPRGK